MKLRLSYTKINTWQSCKMKYYWSYIEQLSPKEKAMPLQIGDIFHKLQHLRFTNQLTPDLLENLEDYVDKLYPSNIEEVSLDVALEAGRLFQGYLTAHKDDQLQCISSEVHCEVELDNCILAGKIDRLVRPADQRLWRFEYKTAGKMDSAYLMGLKGGLQGAIYDFLIEQTFKEMVSGTIYDIVVKTRIPQYNRAYSACNRLAMERMLKTVDGVCSDIKRCEETSGKSPFYPSSNCYSYNSECSYKTLCEFDSPQVRETFYTKKEVIIDENEAEQGGVEGNSHSSS